MCTGIFRRGPNSCFGRNLDVSTSFGERMIFTPRRRRFTFHHLPPIEEGYSLLGAGIFMDDYPLYFDAMNEKGLALAGLNFPSNAFYASYEEGKYRYALAPYELFTYLLRKCASVEEVKCFLKEAILTNESFAANLPLAPLHYFFADQKESLVVEQEKDGLHVYENPYGVLTNNPPFPFQIEGLRKLRGVGPNTAKDNFLTSLSPSYVGSGTIGLPGDFSAPSRFQKCAYLNLHAKAKKIEDNPKILSQILDSVKFIRGAVLDDEGREEVTLYQSVMQLESGVYSLKREEEDAYSSYSFTDLNKEYETSATCAILD